MEFVYEYGLFLAKTATLVIAVLVIAAGIAAVAGRERGQGREALKVRMLNRRYRSFRNTLRHAMSERKGWRRLLGQGRRDVAREAEPRDSDASQRPRVFVLRFEGDIRASRVENLREEITAVLTLADAERDRVVLCLESPGGLVHSYGLAASQLARIRERAIPLTVAVDRVAASGGYLMACVADRIVTAPFAVLGSIGVVAQVPNIHRFLQRHDVDIEMHTAGEHKRTLTVLGENTHAGRRKFQAELDETHDLFKRFVHRYRPELDLERVADGDHWYGEQALELGLADEVRTSDDLLLGLSDEADLYEVTFHRRQPMSKRITLAVETALTRLTGR